MITTCLSHTGDYDAFTALVTVVSSEANNRVKVVFYIFYIQTTLPDKSSDDSLSLGLLDSVPGGGLQLPDQGGQETVQHLG